MVKAFDKILRQGRKPNRLQTDRGKEFYNREFEQWIQKHGIHHFSTDGDAKAALVERFNRTLKERLYRYFTAANTFRFDDQLPLLVEGYNATRHRAIGMAPKYVTWNNEEDVWKRLYGKWLKQKPVRPKFQVGDRVRLNKVHRTFEKGYLDRESVFGASSDSRAHPHVQDSRMGWVPRARHVLQRRFAKSTVGGRRLVSHRELKRQKDLVLVKWKGWPDKYNSWISSRAITSSKKRA